MTHEDISWEIISHIEWNNPLVIVSREYQMLILFKIPYGTTTPRVTCRHMKFHCETLISPLVIHNNIWGLERFTTKHSHEVRKWYVAGCRHLWDPMPEMHINSFALWSDDGLLSVVKTFQLALHEYVVIFIEEIGFQNIVCERASILFRPWYVSNCNCNGLTREDRDEQVFKDRLCSQCWLRCSREILFVPEISLES